MNTISIYFLPDLLAPGVGCHMYMYTRALGDLLLQTGGQNISRCPISRQLEGIGLI